MNVLYVLPEFPPQYGGGIGTHYDALVPAMAAQGHNVDVLVGSAYTGRHDPRASDAGRVEFLDPERRRQAFDQLDAYEAVPHLRRTLAAAWALHEQADRGAGYDVVETTDFGLLFLPWVTATESPPVLVQLHASNGQIDAREPVEGGALAGHFTRLLELQGLACASGLQSYGRPNAQAWSRRLGRTVEYEPPPLAADGPPPGNTAPISSDATGFVAGRIQYWKGPTVLCEAQKRLGSDALLIDWAGRDTDYRAHGESMSAHLASTYPGVWDRTVRPVGQIRPAEVAARQRAADVVVVPSLWDVFNYTAAEAMRTGSVVVCSDGAGAADLIDDGENGFSVPADDPDALAMALDRTARLSTSERRRIGDAARETVVERLAPERIAQQRLDTYRRLSAGDASETRPAPDWLRAAIRPDDSLETGGPPLAFLDQLPLRDLARYVLRRMKNKLFGE